MGQSGSDLVESINLLETPICMSGGAPGADLQFGMNAGRAGHYVIHWSFSGHKTDAPQSEVVQLSEDQLTEAHDALEVANASLKRRIPWQKKWMLNLLRRNYFQVRWSESVYAVSEIDWKTNTVKGGTGWAIEMSKSLALPKIYVYDQKQEAWYVWTEQEWINTTDPDQPTGVYAGIGSRDLQEGGKLAIRRLYSHSNVSPQSPNQ
jgi:hypothetical protein